MADLPYSSRPLVSKAQTAACNLFALHPTLNNVRVGVSEILSIATDNLNTALSPINGSITTINSNIYQNSQRLDAVEGVNTTQNSRLSNLENTKIDHETRITDLEDAPAGGDTESLKEAICRLSTINNTVVIPEIIKNYRSPVQMSIALSNLKDEITEDDIDVVAGYVNNTTGNALLISSIALTLLTPSTDGDFMVEMNVVDIQIVDDEEVESNIPYIGGRLRVPAGLKRFIMTRGDILNYVNDNLQGEHTEEMYYYGPILAIPDGSRVEFTITNCGTGAKGAVINLGLISPHDVGGTDPQEQRGIINTADYDVVCPLAPFDLNNISTPQHSYL